jgi:hypothetical protein
MHLGFWEFLVAILVKVWLTVTVDALAECWPKSTVALESENAIM